MLSNKKYSLITHPDKGGDPEHFNLVTKSYLYLLKALKDNLPEKETPTKLQTTHAPRA